MKKKIFLVIMLSITMLWAPKVNAKIVLKDDIEDNSYIIGNYYYTRTPNSENKYNGTLTTPEIMLAAGTIDGGLDKMIIYHKDFLGNWVNGLTGESITPPEYFEIENRNLRDIISVPELRCQWMTSSDIRYAICDSSFYLDENTVVAARDNSLSNAYKETYGIEYYILKDSDNNSPSGNVSYIDGKFIVGNTKYNPLLIEEQTAYDDTEFYNIVSRFYYLDGEEKIYSEYSNIVNNGALSKLGLTSQDYPKLKATLTDVGLYIDSDNPIEPIYYNVKFNLWNLDTTKYDVREFSVYRLGNDDAFDENIANEMRSLSNSNDTFTGLFLENSYSEKYITPHYGTGYTSSSSGVSGNWYLVAEISGYTSLPEVFNDVSNKTAYSVRFDAEDLQSLYIADVKLCDKINQYVCYNVSTSAITSVK